MALIHQWKLTTDASDSVGGLVTTNNGGVTFDPVNGASFNGTNQWLNFTKTLGTTYSICTWIKPIVADGQFLMAASADGSYSFGFLISRPNLMYGYDGVHFATKTNEWTSANYPNNIFTFVCMTSDGVTIKGYRNNIVNVTATSSGYNNSSTLFSMGRLGAYPGQYYLGGIKDTRIYSHALTTEEIATIVSAGPNGGLTLSQRPQAIGCF